MSSSTTNLVATRGLLDREALLLKLDRAVTRRITVISAPAGSGKTSLLEAWVQKNRATDGCRVAFVSVDRDEQDAQRFWLGVLDALRGPGAHIDPAALAGLDADHLVDMVYSELVEPGKAVALIVDDLHELRSAEALAQLERLLALLPSSARVVLSSRRDPSIKLHRLRLAGEVAEIRGADLRFTEPEARELLAGSGISLSEAAVAALYERTEGWAAGLRLAVISLMRHADPERSLAEFSGTERAIGEYLMAEMLERQPSEVQSMLLRTSIVDRLNGELADLLAGRAGSERMLLELEDANAFVVSLDPQRTWFRYHHLLADFLRLELRRSFINADEVSDLHRRAAGWLADHGEPVDAARHLLAAGNWTDAARQLSVHLFSLTLDGQEGTIAGLLRSFPAGVASDDPELALALAAVELAQGRLETAAAQLTLADAHVKSAPSGRRGRLAVAIASLRLALARRSGQFTEVMEQVELLDASTAGELSRHTGIGSELRAVALMNLGIVETWSGRFDDAERHLSEGAALARSIDRPYLEVACRAHQGFASKTVSRSRPPASARVRRSYWPSATAWKIVRYSRPHSRVLVASRPGWANSTRQSAGYAEPGRWPSLTSIRPPLCFCTPRRECCTQLAGGIKRRSKSSPRHCARRRYSQVCTLSVRRLPDGSRRRKRGSACTLRRAQRSPDSPWRTNWCTAFAPRAQRSVLRRETPVRHWISCRTCWRRRPRPVFLRNGLVEAHLHAGIAHLHLGDRNAAAASAEAALEAAESDRLIFPFAMIETAELLDALPRHETAHGALPTDIVDVLRGGPALTATARLGSPAEELSASELRVLRYLPTNLTRPEIARELYVSINTVNSHIRNIYSKLGASDRSAAVSRARELRLLSSSRH